MWFFRLHIDLRFKLFAVVLVEADVALKSFDGHGRILVKHVDDAFLTRTIPVNCLFWVVCKFNAVTLTAPRASNQTPDPESAAFWFSDDDKASSSIDDALIDLLHVLVHIQYRKIVTFSRSIVS